MGDIYLDEIANNIVELGKHVEERRSLHIRDGGTCGLAGRLHSGRRRNIWLRGRSEGRRKFLCVVVIEAVYRRRRGGIPG